ncbi:MAG: DNA polymerase I [Anaerolineae bacterium]
MSKPDAGPEILILIDGYSLAYRAYHALPTDLSTSKGELTNAVYGFASMLLNVLRDYKPDYIAIAFDVGPSFRHQEFAAYKAQRPATPDELTSQLRRIGELVEAFRIPVYTAEGYEADDVLGTLARQAAERGLNTLIVTGDRDALQLVGPHVRVLTSGRRFSDVILYDEKAVRERFGLAPRQLVDLKALVGDKSDNIPGVPGIGEKTATRLLQQYGSLEGIYEHLDEVEPPKVREALAGFREEAFQYRRLVTIAQDAPVTLDLERCRTGQYDVERVKALFRELEFRSLLDRLPAPPKETTGPAQLHLFPQAVAEPQALRVEGTGLAYETIAQPQSLQGLAERLRGGPFAFDTETDSTDPLRARLVGISLAAAPGQAWYLPVGHQKGPNLPLEAVREHLGPLFAGPQVPKYAHHAKYDMEVLARHGLPVQGLAFDTMLAEWLCNPSSQNLGLKNLAWVRLGEEMTTITQLLGKGKEQTTMDRVPVAEAAPYACADADMTFRLVPLLAKELEEKQLTALYRDVELPLVDVLMTMECNGILLDVPYLRQMSEELSERLRDLEARIYELVGYSFNINSPAQLGEALFERLHLPRQGLRKTQAGHYSTAAEVLEKLRGLHPAVDLILEHRQIAKIKSTYVDALPELVNPETGRLHTSYNQTGTVTGRLSSSEPNLQNIPIRTELGRRVRRAFRAEEGWLFLSADYSQVELRIVAHVSQDPAMLQAFARGEDIHASTAAAIYGVPLEAVTPEMRRVAKTVNFAITYGATGFGVAQQSDLTPEEGAKLVEAYYRTYPKVRDYVERTKKMAREQGYVQTLLGRRRYFPEFQATERVHQNRLNAAYRMAINAPIQGTAADIIKLAMIRIHRALQEQGLRTRMTLQVHDELVFEVPKEELGRVAPLVREIMEGAFPLDAPLKVDMKVGANWEEMDPL